MAFNLIWSPTVNYDTKSLIKTILGANKAFYSEVVNRARELRSYT